MQKGILLSTRPKWVAKITHKIGEIDGKAIYEKTIEVRKTRPKLETPFKVYIYCTKDGLVIYGNGKQYVTDSCEFLKGSAVEAFENSSGFYKWNGKVIGEFVCDRIDSYVGKDDDNREYWDLSVEEWEDLKGKSCLTIKQICDYTGDSHNCYGWHITDLKIYEKPKELSEFKRFCDSIGGKIGCSGCPYYYSENTESGSYEECCCDNLRPITRPPQSWCYVETTE